mgnify:CR=1 FL=1
MKSILKYVICGMVVCGMASCDDLYETHRQYLEMGEQVYIGKADSLEANGGYNRVELKWQLNADPKIKTCVISWNGCEEPVVVEADRTQKVMSKIVEVPEGNYIFSIVVESASGKQSLEQTISGTSYGDNYRATLPQRGISSVDASPEGVTIHWQPEEGCIGVNLEYTNKQGEKKVLRVGEEDETTFIEDYVPGSEYVLTSIYKPELEAIDEIPSLPTTRTFPAYYVISKEDWENKYHALYADIDRTGWTVEASTEEAGGEGPVNGYATALLDGDLSTFWHSAWQNATPSLPHVITIDMKMVQDITSIELARRANNKDTKTVSFSISEDGATWTDLGEVSFPNNPAPNAKILLLAESVSGRYIRATVTESNNKPHASIAEIMFTSPQK